MPLCQRSSLVRVIEKIRFMGKTVTRCNINVNSMFCEVMFNINYEIPVYGKDFVNWDYKKLYIESL